MPGRLYPKSFEGQAPQEFGIGANILKTRTFDLAAARDLEEIEIGGSCIWAVAASSLTASIDIRINDQLRDPVTFQQGMFIRGIPYSRIYVSHAAQVGATITMFFAVEEDVRNIQIINPSSQFNHVNVGNIAQDDSWFYDTSQLNAYIGGYVAVNGLQVTNCIQLWNPAASGFNLICDNVSIFSDAAATVTYRLNHHNAALTGAGTQGNKWLTEADGVGLVLFQELAAAPGAEILRFNCNVLTERKLDLQHPIIIDPGTGLVVGCQVANCRLSVVFNWIEKAI